jgi:hypothetical protein
MARGRSMRRHCQGRRHFKLGAQRTYLDNEDHYLRPISTFDITSPSSSSLFGENSMCARRRKGGGSGRRRDQSASETMLEQPAIHAALGRSRGISSMTSSTCRLMVVLWPTFKQDRKGRHSRCLLAIGLHLVRRMREYKVSVRFIDLVSAVSVLHSRRLSRLSLPMPKYPTSGRIDPVHPRRVHLQSAPPCLQ